MKRSSSTEHLSSRPSLPPLLLAGAALWVGCLLESEVLAGRGVTGYVTGGVGVFASIALFGIALRRNRLLLPGVFALFFSLGLILSAVSLSALETQRASLIDLSGETFTLRVLDDASEGQFGSYCTAVAYPLNAGFVERQFGGFKVRLNLDDNELTYGDEVQAHLTLKEPSDTAKASYDRKRIVFSCKLYKVQTLESSQLGVIARSRGSFAEQIVQLSEAMGLSNEAAYLTQALLLGNRSELFSSTLYQEVKTVGLAHMVAVSGAHLVIVMGFVGLVLKSLRVGKRFQVGFQLVFLFLYLAMVGFPVSCMRAAFMSSAGMVSLATSRRSYSLSALGATCLVLIALDSSAASSVSFGLSALSTLGIILFMPLFTGWFKVSLDRVNRYVLEPVAMTLAALLLTLPLSLALFCQLPLVSPLSNVVASPLVSIVCSVGVAAYALQQVPVVGHLFLGLSLVASQLLAWCVSGMAQLPFACIPLGVNPVLACIACIGCCAVLWLRWPKKFPVRICSAFACLLLVVGLAGNVLSYGSTQVIMLDVGQGDAVLLRSRGSTLLIDTGNQTSKLYAGLSRYGITHLDAVLITHADDDHCGSLSALKGVVPCDKVVVAAGIDELDLAKTEELLETAEAYVGEQNVVEVRQGSNLSIGAFRCNVISPAELTDEGGNQDSICLLTQADCDDNGTIDWTCLFTGDAEAETLEKLELTGRIGKVDLWKVSHHGARAALTDELASQLSPKVALIGVGQNNTYGHPTAETLSRLEQVGANIFRTDEMGDVVCDLTAQRIQVTTLR